MTDRPIIFSAPMIRALLDGRKTQTRRVLNPQPIPFAIDEAGTLCKVDVLHFEGDRLPRIALGRVITRQEVRFAVGDRLWVREACSIRILPQNTTDGLGRAWFKADSEWARDDRIRWRPSIHMPRWASRLTLDVTGVKVERLQDIGEEDAKAEGARGMPTWGSHRNGFNAIWLEIHGPDAWSANPWVAAITFTVKKANIDTLPTRVAA